MTVLGLSFFGKGTKPTLSRPKTGLAISWLSLEGTKKEFANSLQTPCKFQSMNKIQLKEKE